jgi:two-component system NarL family sensor kinase
MFKLKIVLFIFLFLSAMLLHGQDKAPKNDIIAKIAFADKILMSDMKRANRVLDSILIQTKKHKFNAAEARVFNFKAIVCIYTGKPDSALYFLQKYEEIGISLGDQLTIAKAKQNKNLPLATLGRYTEAIQTLLSALTYYENINDKQGMAGAYGDMGNILIRQRNPKEAIVYLKKALAIADEINKPAMKANFYNSLAVSYGDLEDYKSERDIYLKALEIAEKLNNVKSQVLINLNLGRNAMKLEKTAEKGFDYYIKAEKLALIIGDNTSLAYIYQNVSRHFYHEKDYSQALKYATKAKDLALKTKDLYGLEKIYISLADIYKGNKQYDEAFKALTLQDSVAKIIFDKQASKQINELREKYEVEKKQQQIVLLNNANQIQSLELNKNRLEIENKDLENDRNVFKIGAQELLLQKNKIELLKKQEEAKTKAQKIKLLASQNQVQNLELTKRNIFLASMAGVLLITILLSYLLYNRYKLKQEARLQEEVIVQQDLATRAVLSAEENERKRISGELHDGLGQMFSAVKMNLSALTNDLNFKNDESKKMFVKTMDLVDESCKEVRVISHQMAPNVLLKSGLAAAVRDFINKIDSRKLRINLETFGLQERIDQNIEAVLYRVIQETVNNVIKHSGANELDIQLNRDEDGINAMIEDNGKGFDTSQLEKFEGIGLKNISTRIKFLKGTVDFSSSPNQGTLIAIFIPF